MVKIGPLYGGSESVTWWFNITVKVGPLYGGSESVIWWFNIWCKSVHSMVGVSPQFGDLIWCCVSITNLYNGIYGVLILLPDVMTVLIITVFFILIYAEDIQAFLLFYLELTLLCVFLWHVCPGRHPQMATTRRQVPPPGGTQFIARKVSVVLIFEVIVIFIFGLYVNST